MRSASAADIEVDFSCYLDACREGPVIVTKNGHAAAVLLCVEDDDELERLIMAHNRKLRGIVEDSLKNVRETGGVSEDEVWGRIEAGMGWTQRRLPRRIYRTE